MAPTVCLEHHLEAPPPASQLLALERAQVLAVEGEPAIEW
jgi:hypothetical protein